MSAANKSGNQVPSGQAAGQPRARRLDLDGPSNFRDLGGLPVTGGGSTRFGLVYRADRLCTLSDADLRRLEEIGIRHVFDLRSRLRRPTSPTGCRRGPTT